MYQKISLNDFTIRQAPFADRFNITREVRFSGIEFQIDEARDYAKEHGGLDSVLGLLRRNNLRFDQSMMLRDCFSPAHKNDREAFLRHAEGFFQDTKFLGGKVVLTCATFGPAEMNEAPEMFGELCDLADSFGINLALEFIGWAETIKDIRTARSIVEKADRKNGGILYDTLHHYFGGSSFRDLEELPTEHIFAVHIVDVNDMDIHPMEISRHHRVFPGKGVIPIPEILDILHAKGYQGSLALEIFNDKYLTRPPLEVAREGFEVMKGILSRAGFD
ncbi:MAG: sugar phosphate isomerase/epimerase [Deltaproteobacteria bacterium]|nr:sugar phosphate isomerase/epimerase [Deltaproteobacteria bacterium]